jgi:heptosyltransferase II
LTGGAVRDGMPDVSLGLSSAGRVLVRLPNWLGDALMARPFLAALRTAAPRARLTAIGPPALLELLAGDAAWDDALPWPLPAGANPAQGGRPDAAFVLPPSFSSARFAWSTGAAQRVGFAGELRELLLTRAPRRPARGEMHLACEYLSLLGAPQHGLPPVKPLVLPATAGAQAAVLLGEAGLAGGPLAVLAPGALFGPAKRWPVGRFAALAVTLAGRGHAVAVCGGGSERAACDAVLAGCGRGAVSLAGRTSLPVQAALCARAAVVVSNDSGMAHLAGAVGAPTVAIFGSTASAWTAPLGPRVRVVQHAPVCAPCFRRTCRIGYRCLDAVAVDDVLRALGDLAEGAREEVPA